MKVGFEHPLPTGMLIIALHKIHKLFQNKSLPLKHYKVLQHPGGLGSGATVRVSFLFLVTFLLFFTKKRKKVTEEFEIKERI
jgi:hypothetical protein